MTWTYSDTLAADKDKVRLLVGDTDSTAPLISDEAIAFSLTKEGSLYRAAALVCRQIAASFARRVQVSADGFSTSADQHRKYLEMAAQYEAEDAKDAGGSLGIESPLAAVSAGADQRDPIFTVGMDDNPEAGGGNTLTGTA